MARTSRFPGFYKITVAERRALVGDATGADPRDIERALEGGGLDAETADKFVENVLGTYALPYGVALNVRVNGHDHVVPDGHRGAERRRRGVQRGQDGARRRRVRRRDGSRRG